MTLDSLKHNEKSKNSNPPIPEKHYFSISEVSELCDVKPHVLRYWEQEFKQLRPAKRRGNRRYYQRKDVVMIREIKTLLYDEGYTIIGARQRLSGENIAPSASAVDDSLILNELAEVLQILQASSK